MKDVRDFYITYPGHPKFKEGEIIVEDPLRVIINKIEMVLFTTQGEFIGDVNFGANIPFYLWETNVSVDYIRSNIQQQFDTYIPELRDINSTLNVEVTEGELQDILFIDVQLNETQVRAVFR